MKANVGIEIADGCRRAIEGRFDVLCVAMVMLLSQDLGVRNSSKRVPYKESNHIAASSDKL